MKVRCLTGRTINSDAIPTPMRDREKSELYPVGTEMVMNGENSFGLDFGKSLHF